MAPSSDAAKVLANLGVSITDTSGKMLPFSQVMDQLKTKLPTSEVDRAAAIFTIFGRQAGSAAQILIDTGAPALDAMTARLVESTGAAERQATTLNQGLGGAFERMKGSIETAGIALGTALAPVAEKVAGFIETLADKAGALASWFGTLPEPVQTIVIGLAGLVAAVGPLLVAFGSVASAIGSISAVIPIITSALSTVAAAFSWPVIAIAAVTAALVAFGVWVYTNWDSIVAVVSQAWDGITELWGAIWDHITAYLGPIWDGIRSAAQTVFGWFAPFFTYLWDSVKSAFTTAWDGIKDFLSSVWNSIKSVAESVWGAITGAFRSFIEWAEKIPGVNKLLSLDEAWNSAKKLGEQTNKNTKSIKDNADATTKDSEEVAALKARIKELLAQLDKSNKSRNEGTTAVTAQIKPTKQLSTEMKILSEMIQIRVKRQNEAIRKIAEERVAQEDGTVATEDYAAGFAKLNQALMESMAQHKDLASSIPPVISQMAQLSGPVDAYYEALTKAGITSTETYNQIAADAQATYDAIANDPRATEWEQDNAMLRLLRAQADAARASGTEISAAQQQTLDDLEAKVNGKKPAVVNSWKTMNDSIQQSVTDLSTSMVKDLFEGDFSFAEKGITAIKGLGQAVATHFITPATTAISNFISGAITDLLSGKGLGGILSSLKELGSSMSSIFGSASSAAGNAAGAGANAGGGLATAVSGLTSTLTTVFSGLNAAAGVVSAITSIRQEGTLNAIEHNTRYTMMYAGERADGGILGEMFRLREEVSFGTGVKAIETMRDAVIYLKDNAIRLLDSVSSNTYWSLRKLEDWHWGFLDMPGTLRSIRDYAAAPHTVNVTINGASLQSGADIRALARQVATELGSELRLQTV